MNNVFDFAIVGNNVAALVAAHSLNSKYRIALINPTPVWGGHFGGIVAAGERYDLGMNFFEFTSLNDKSDDLLSYDPSLKNDCGRFFHIVENYVKTLVKVHEVTTPQMLIDGLYLKDAIIANQFGGLSNLPSDLKVQIIHELEVIIGNKNELHASNKKIDEERFIQNSYKVVSLANHGKTFHGLFIEPLCQKVLNTSSDQIPALFHRIAWAPLLYPETLLAFIKNERSEFPKTLFHYPESGYFSILVERLRAEVKQQRNITIIEEKASGIIENGHSLIELANKELIECKQLIWAMDLGQYLKLRSNIEPESFDRTSIAMIFIKINSGKVKRKISALNIIDNRYSIYRLTNQTFSSGHEDEHTKLVAEINYDYYKLTHPGVTEEDLANYTSHTLKELNIIEDLDAIKDITVKVMKNVLNLPTLANFKRFQAMQSSIGKSSQGNLMLMAQSSGYVSTSLNDQIVQGLKIGKNFN